ncbi:aminoglycoside phosphotransferase family protein [Thioclava sp. BHET1]|nr:aminoglycoside phosphotransferase family protein [Thioclava sp. BHET1]
MRDEHTMTCGGDKPEMALAAFLKAHRSQWQVQPIAATMSPLRRGCDAESRLVWDASRRVMIKRWHHDLPLQSGARDIATMTQAAAAAGCTPPVLDFVQSPDAMLLEGLAPPWRDATIGELRAPVRLAKLLSLKRAIHRLPPFPVDVDVFAQIRALPQKDLPVPAEESSRIFAAVRQLEAQVTAEGVDRVPAHADGAASNVMIDEGDGMQLVDFDAAGNTDPLYDLAVTLSEIWPLAPSIWAPWLEELIGSLRDADLERMQAYAFADDVKWALFGFAMDRGGSRAEVEFLKYGQWRWLRARMALDRHMTGLRGVS